MNMRKIIQYVYNHGKLENVEIHVNGKALYPAFSGLFYICFVNHNDDQKQKMGWISLYCIYYK